MKKLIFLLFFTLFSCTKDRENFACDCIYTHTSIDGNCQYTVTKIGEPHDNLTDVEMIDWIDQQKIEVIQIDENGRDWKVTGKCHCLNYVCPKY